VAYKKDQGRYARMFSFWALFLLVGYGCFGDLVITLRGWIGQSDPWVEELPLLGDVDLAMAISIGILVVSGLVIHRLLNRPKSVDMLIETEAEMRKVTWPSFAETWTGTLAVILTVAVLFVYLFTSDLVLSFFMRRALGS
jgi:preprotein translocase SecE subunit